jgi:hypothetical protein
MPEFTVRYWFDDKSNGEQHTYISQGLTAESLDEATRLVQDQMAQALFTFDSDGHGRVVVNKNAVRFCSLVPAQTPEEAAMRVQADAAANAQTDFQTRAAASVDRDTRRF